MACVEGVVGVVTALLILAGVAVSANVATVLSAIVYFINTVLLLFSLYSVSTRKRLSLGLFYRSTNRDDARQQHIAVFVFSALWALNAIVVGWQLWLETRVEHTDAESQSASVWRALQGTYFLFLVLFVHFCERKKYPGDTTGCVNPRHGLFTAVIFSVFVQIIATIVAVDGYVYGANPLFPAVVVGEQAAFVVWSVGYTWWAFLGLSRCVGIPCSAHESTVIKRKTSVISLNEELVVNEL